MPAESFLDVARALLEDPGAKAEFVEDPGAFLASRGFEDLAADDLADAAGFVTEALPPGVAARLGPPDALGDDPLGLFAALEPVSIDEPSVDDGGDGAAGNGEVPDAEDGFAALDVSVPDPGFGVGYTDDDLDDLSPPEVHEGDLPVGFELQVDEAGFAEPNPDPGAGAEADAGDADHDGPPDDHGFDL